MSTIRYSIDQDFSGNLKPGQFHSEIEANTSITTTFIGLLIDSGNVDVQFTENLQASEVSVLNTLVNLHVPDSTIPRISSKNINVVKSSFNNNDWIRIGFGQFPGSESVGNINYIDCLTSMDSNTNDYTIKVLDRNNPGSAICEGTFSNTSLEFNSLGAISNTPTESTMLEFLGKVNGNGFVEVNELVYWYNN